jgi:hydroxyacylglutathione hydrolase
MTMTMTTALQITAIPCRTDNYAYLIRRDGSDEAWIVDPSSIEPVRAALDAGELKLRGIILTHHHHDHVDGVPALLDWAGEPAPWVAGHVHDRGRISGQSEFIEAGSTDYVDSGLRVAGVPLEAMHVPGHTLGAVAWKLGEDVFTGDTLFAGGCGRLFEGTADQLQGSLQRLVEGPSTRRLWFGHEYTAANLRFALQERPEDAQIQERLASLKTPSTPTTVDLERRTNLFVQAGDAEVLASLRARKDVYRDT